MGIAIPMSISHITSNYTEEVVEQKIEIEVTICNIDTTVIFESMHLEMAGQ